MNNKLISGFSTNGNVLGEALLFSISKYFVQLLFWTLQFPALLTLLEITFIGRYAC